MQTTSQKRLPTLSDFVPCGCNVSITPPPAKDTPGNAVSNVLILLHGLGDTETPFAKLAEQLKLPYTACISVRAPNALPFHENSFHWGDDLIFDSSTSALDPQGGFIRSTELLQRIISEVIIGQCGFQARDVILFGLGQGGMAALNIAVTHVDALGGVVSIGGPLPSAAPASSNPLKTTPVLVCSGSNSQWIDAAAKDRLERNFKHVQFSRYKRVGDGMPQNREEMLPVMEFFSRRLRQAPPIGTIELT